MFMKKKNDMFVTLSYFYHLLSIQLFSPAVAHTPSEQNDFRTASCSTLHRSADLVSGWNNRMYFVISKTLHSSQKLFTLIGSDGSKMLVFFPTYKIF